MLYTIKYDKDTNCGTCCIMKGDKYVAINVLKEDAERLVDETANQTLEKNRIRISFLQCYVEELERRWQVWKRFRNVPITT